MKKPRRFWPAPFAAIVLMVFDACATVSPASGSCSASQLMAIKQARSVVAETAYAAELHAAGRTTSTFNDELLQQADDELTSARRDLQGNEQASSLIDAAHAQIKSGNGADLRALADELLALERADEQCP